MKRGSVMLLLALAACGTPLPSHIPQPAGGARLVAPEMALGFHQQAAGFYTRLIQRRFNALETFNDPFLRQHFASDERFYDYYASLAQSMEDSDFEKNRPWAVEVEELLFEAPGRAWVQVRFRGADDRPLRPGNNEFVRFDRWELRGESWSLVPARL